MISERLMLFSGTSLLMSQNSYGPKKFQFGPAQERPEHDQDAPEHEEAEQEDRDLAASLLEREVAVALRVRVDVRDRHQADDDERRQDDAGQPRVEVDEHLLQAQEVPRRLRRVRRVGRVGRLLERRLQDDRPDDHHGHDDDEADELDVDEVRPREDLLRRVLASRSAAVPARSAGRSRRPGVIANQKKKPTRKIMPTIGTLSGSVATLLKLGSRYERPMPPATQREQHEPALRRPELAPVDQQDQADQRARDEVLRRRQEVDRVLDELDEEHRVRPRHPDPLPADGAGTLESESSQPGPRDAAVLADAPEVDGHQERRDRAGCRRSAARRSAAARRRRRSGRRAARSARRWST